MRLVETVSEELKKTWKQFHSLEEGQEKKKTHHRLMLLQEERMESRDLGLYANIYEETPPNSGVFKLKEKN